MIDSSQHESQRDALHGKHSFNMKDLPVQETKRYKGKYKPGRPLGAVDVIQEPWMQKPFKLPVQAVTQEQGDTASACQLAVRYPKRITNKQPLPPSWQRWYVSEFRRLELTWRDTRAAVDAHRLWYHRLFVAHDMCAGSADYAEQKRHMREASADHYKGMNPGEKALWAVSVHNGDLPVFEPQAPQGTGQADGDDEPKEVHGMLFTFHGEWGFNDPSVIRLVDEGLRGEELSKALKHLPVYAELGKRFFQVMCHVGAAIGWNKVSVSVEHCPKAAAEHPARVHLHVFLSESSSKNEKRVSRLKKLVTFERVPSANAVPMKCTSKENDAFKAKRVNEGHYYLQFPKTGLLFQQSSWRKNEHFAVLRKFIMNQLTHGKMSLEDAIDEVLLTQVAVRSAVTDLEFQIQRRDGKSMNIEAQRVQDMLESNLAQFIDTPPVIREWLDQYHEKNYGVNDRFKPLVLDGDSRFGKTTWAQSFFGQKYTCMVNCQGSCEIVLKSYGAKRNFYKCILFDESNWELIHKNKKVFQAGAKMIECGQSPTAQHLYELWLYQVPMICCGNDFFHNISPEAHKYLEKNIVLFTCNEFCYKTASTRKHAERALFD